MRKTWWIIPSLLLLASTSAPNVNADSLVDPATINTKAGGELTLGDGLKLTDTATVAGANAGAFPGTLTFVLTDPTDGVLGVSPTSGIQLVGGNGLPVSVDSSVSPTLAGTYNWTVTFKGADGTTATSEKEPQVVLPTPELGAGALMLAGIGFLLVCMRKRCASGLTPTS